MKESSSFNKDIKKKNSSNINDTYETFVEPGKKKHIIPKNINIYQHLIRNNINTAYGELRWAIGLRGYPTQSENTKSVKDKENQTNNKNTIPFHPPKFYEDDLTKYKERNSKRPFSTNPNFRKVSHLIKNPTGETVDITQYTFETSLRTFYPKKGTSKWVEEPYYNSQPKYSFPLPLYQPAKDAFSKVDKYTLHPFTARYDEVVVGKDKIKRKKLYLNQNEIYGNFNDNLALIPYNTLYQDANTYANKDLLDKHTNSQCLFELGLRTNGPIQRTRTKRKSKVEMEKEKEKLTQAKRDKAKQDKLKRNKNKNN